MAHACTLPGEHSDLSQSHISNMDWDVAGQCDKTQIGSSKLLFEIHPCKELQDDCCALQALLQHHGYCAPLSLAVHFDDLTDAHGVAALSGEDWFMDGESLRWAEQRDALGILHRLFLVGLPVQQRELFAALSAEEVAVLRRSRLLLPVMTASGDSANTVVTDESIRASTDSMERGACQIFPLDREVFGYSRASSKSGSASGAGGSAGEGCDNSKNSATLFICTDWPRTSLSSQSDGVMSIGYDSLELVALQIAASTARVRRSQDQGGNSAISTLPPLLDLYCGSGVQAIVAQKWCGFECVAAVDINDRACRCTMFNMALNGCFSHHPIGNARAHVVCGDAIAALKLRPVASGGVFSLQLHDTDGHNHRVRALRPAHASASAPCTGNTVAWTCTANPPFVVAPTPPSGAAIPLYAAPAQSMSKQDPDAVLRTLVARAAADGVGELLFVSEVSNSETCASTIARWGSDTFEVSVLHCPEELESIEEYAAARAAEYESGAGAAASLECWLREHSIVDRALVLGRLRRCSSAALQMAPRRHLHSAATSGARQAVDELLTPAGLQSIFNFAVI